MHASRWPWLTLLACAAASGGAGAQGVVPSDAGVAPPAPPVVEGEEEPAREWRLPPLRLSGSLAYETRVTRGNGEPNSVSHTLTGTVGTSTYIYQPWLATISGTLGLSTSVSRSAAPTLVTGPFNDSEVHDHLRGRENFVTGSARLDLFPRSRFPAEVHIERQDSRVDTGLASPIAFTRQNIGASMRYRPESGLYNLVGTFAHNDQWGSGFRSSQDSVSADFTTHWKHNELGLGGNFSRARSEGLDDESRFTGLVARHTYTPSNELSINSTANLTRTEDRGIASSDLQVMQLSSIGLYHPDRSPLTLTGSVRGLLLRDREAGSANDSFGATVGANYEVSPNLRLTANGGANINRSDAGDSHSFSGTVGASYQGDTLEWRKFQYNWFAGASAGAAVGTSTQLGTVTDQNVGLQLGHSVGRAWPLSSQSNLSLNATQSLSVSHSTSSREQLGSGLGTVKSMLNSVAASWQQAGDGQNAFARVSYSDSMELGGGRARFQLFNFQLSGNMDLGYGRSVTGDLTYQRTLQRASDLLATGDDASVGLRTRSAGAAGEITFRQNKLFGIPRLRFSSRVRLAQDVLHQPGQLLSIPDRETRLWENRLDWSIGRLETQLVLRISKIDGTRIDSLWLRVQRTFGD